MDDVETSEILMGGGVLDANVQPLAFPEDLVQSDPEGNPVSPKVNVQETQNCVEFSIPLKILTLRRYAETLVLWIFWERLKK